MDVPKQRPKRMHYLLVGLAGMFFAGVLYAWSILKVPFSTEFEWAGSALALNFTIAMCFFCLGGLFAGLLLRKLSGKWLLVLGAVLVGAGFCLVATLSAERIFFLYIFYGGLCGLGIGVSYTTILTLVGAWFLDKKGMCSGVLMMGFGASTLILGNIANVLFEMPAFGWRKTYLLLGIVIGVVLLLASLILRSPTPDEMAVFTPAAPQNAAEVESVRDYSPTQMLRRFTFWRFFLFSITLAAVGNTVISFAKDLSMNAGASAALATTLVGILSVFNGLGRILAGFCFDTLQRKRTMLIGNFFTILAPILLLGAVLWTSVPLCIVGLCITGISYGFSPTINSVFTRSFYGHKHYAMNFSLANTVLIPSSFVATFAASLVSTSGSYLVPLALLFGFSILSLLLNFSIRRP